MQCCRQPRAESCHPEFFPSFPVFSQSLDHRTWVIPQVAARTSAEGYGLIALLLLSTGDRRERSGNHHGDDQSGMLEEIFFLFCREPNSGNTALALGFSISLPFMIINVILCKSVKSAAGLKNYRDGSRIEHPCSLYKV